MSKDPIKDWVDVDEVRRLAEALSSPVESSSTKKGALSQPLSQKTMSQGSFRLNSAQTGKPDIVHSVSVFSEDDREPFIARMQQFSEWLKLVSQGYGVFICDRDGTILYDEMSDPRLIQVAASLAGASRAALRATSYQHSHQRIEIDDKTGLETLSARTRYGFLMLGIMTAQPLQDQIAEKACLGFCRAANGDDV